MMHEKFLPLDFDDFRFLERHVHVRVSINRRDRSDFFQFQNDGGKADVARVQNMLDAREQFENFRVEIAVGVRNDAYFHASASCGSVSASGSRAPAVLSAGDSADEVNFSAATNNAVNNPPLNNVLRKNSSVDGQPLVPLVSAKIQPARFFVYSGLKNH